MKNILSSAIILFFNAICFAQVSQQWVQRYNGPVNYHDRASYIAVDPAGNIYVTGNSNYLPHVEIIPSNIVTIKYSPAGVVLWTAIYRATVSPDSSANIPAGIVLDANGNVYVAGTSIVHSALDAGGTTSFISTIKYNSAGVQQWAASFTAIGSQRSAAGITVDNLTGNVYVAGTADVDYLVVRYTSSGTLLGANTYHGPGNGGNCRAIVSDNGFYYVTGSNSGVGTNSDVATIKYNSAGVEQWVQRYNGPANSSDVGVAIKVDAAGNVFVTGNSWGGATNYDYITIKYNSAGNSLWGSRYNGIGSATDQSTSLVIDNSGNVYVTGYSFGSATSYDFATVKYNSTGALQWVQRYDFGTGGNRDDRAFSIALDAGGNIYVTGWSSSSTFNDYATLKYNPAGVEQWVQRYNGPGSNDDAANDIAVDNQNNVYVTGYSYGSGSEDYATIKYSQPVGLHNISGELPDKCSLSQNYPNPFNPSTRFRFQIADFAMVQLKVYSVLGVEQAVIVNEQLQPGDYEIQWDAGNYPSGIYYYILSSGTFRETKKMILIK